MLGAIAGDGEIVCGARVGNSSAASFLRSEVDDTRVEREEEIVAAAVQRKIFDGLLADETAHVLSGGADHGSITGDGDFCFYRAYLQLKIDAGFLAHNEVDAAADGVPET